MARGDIFTVELPTPSRGAGHEQMGSRPAVVVQTDIADGMVPTTMVVPITSNSRALRFPYTFAIDPSERNGLAKRSVALVFQLRAIDVRRLGARIGRLEAHHLQKLETEMRCLLGM